MQGLEDVEAVDGEPVAASLIPRAVTAGELVFEDGATQTFDANGDTRYVEADLTRYAADAGLIAQRSSDHPAVRTSG
jgi:hypothetical protein